MKNLLLILSVLIFSSCQKEELPSPRTTIKQTEVEQQFVEIRLVGLKQDIAKQIVLICGPKYLDTIVVGNFVYRVPVTQKLMNTHIRIRSLQPIWDNIYFKGTYQVGFSPGCEYTSTEFSYLFEY